MEGLEQAVVAITGSTRGVGREIAEAFLAGGASVVVNGRDPAVGAGCLAELDAGDRVAFHGGDVTRQATVEGLVDATVERFGRLDVLVLNAGGTRADVPIVDTEDDEWRRLVDLNLSHVFWGMRRALRHMLPRRSGRIIVTSAVEGKLPRPGASAYVAAKHGVNGLVKSVAHEVGPLGITVNAILPGVLETSVRDGVASVAVLLASPEMTSVTGCLFPVDGGAMPY
jgi:3-hydroxybutyrate dehydrogenase